MNMIPRPPRGNGYPTGDGKPMAETELHLELMNALRDALRYHYRHRDDVCASGNLLMFYEEGDRRRHVSPDVFVTFGVPTRERENYLVWEERRPDVVFEITSSSTRREDTGAKLELYRDVLGVREYFLFDPRGDWLDPPMQGFRLRAGQYVRIRPTPEGRLPSRVLHLELERQGRRCRLWDPATGRHLPTPAERAERAEADNDRLRRELDELRRRLGE